MIESQKELFHEKEITSEEISNPNPMVKLHGFWEPRTKCKNCKKLLGIQYSKVYYKCSLRKNTHGPATDHRVNWDACMKFEDNK